MKIPLKHHFPPSGEPPLYFISVMGWVAPIEVTFEAGRTVVRIRRNGVLGVEDEDLSRKLTWASEKLRQLKEKGETRL